MIVSLLNEVENLSIDEKKKIKKNKSCQNFTIEYDDSCGFIYVLYYIEVRYPNIHFVESFYHKLMFNFVKSVFLHLLRWIIWFAFFSLLTRLITLIYLRILKHSGIPRINTTIWLWYIILSMYHWIQFADVLLRIFAFVFICIGASNFLFFCDIFVWFWY